MDEVTASMVTGADGAVDPAAVREVIDRTAASAGDDRRAFEPPADPPDPEAARRYLRTGAGRAVGVYILLRTGDRLYRFPEDELDRLEGALHTWLALYAACYGRTIEPDVTIRTAAEVLIETDDVGDMAAVVTGIP